VDLLDLDEMDNQEANISTVKLTHHQSDINDILSILIEVVCASTKQKMCIFIFIYFCSFFEVLKLVYRPTTYTNAQLLSASHILGQTVKTMFSVTQARKACRDHKGLDRKEYRP